MPTGVAILLCGLLSACDQGDLSKALAYLQANRYQEAVPLLDRILAQRPDDRIALRARGEARAGLQQFAGALEDMDRLCDTAPVAPVEFHLRGTIRFRAGHVEKSIEDFDEYIRLKPEAEREHWQRGIAYYLAGRYEEGARQFQLYQTYYASDVENVVWHFLCRAKVMGVESARKEMLALAGDDRRVPLMEIDRLFRGTSKPERVREVAEENRADPESHREGLFYAHLYLALYYDAADDRMRLEKHLTDALGQQQSHYMADVARVYLDRLQRDTKQPK